MSPCKKNYSSDFKSKIVLELLSGDSSLLELCTKYKLPKRTLGGWQSKAIKDLKLIFDNDIKHKKDLSILRNKIEDLTHIIGEISVENKYYKKKLKD